MPTLDRQISATSDIGGREPDDFYDGAEFGDVLMGDVAEDLNVWLRFPNITVPSGSTINVAYITIVSNSIEDAGTINHKIIGVDEDDHAAPTNDAAWVADHAIPTTAQVDWDFAAATGSLQSPSIVSIIQEIIDRGGWASGNDIGIHFDDDGTSAASIAIGLTPTLHIEYTAPGGGDASIAAEPWLLDTPTVELPYQHRALPTRQLVGGGTAYSDPAATTITSTTTSADQADFEDPAATTITSTTTGSSQADFDDFETTVITSTTAGVDQADFDELASTTGSSTTTGSDQADFDDGSATTITSTTTGADRADYLDTAATTITSTTTGADGNNFDDASATTITSTTTGSSQADFDDFETTVITSTTAGVDQADFDELASTTGSSTTTGSDQADFDDGSATTITSTTTGADRADYLDTAATTITSTTVSIDELTGFVLIHVEVTADTPRSAWETRSLVEAWQIDVEAGRWTVADPAGRWKADVPSAEWKAREVV